MKTIKQSNSALNCLNGTFGRVMGINNIIIKHTTVIWMDAWNGPIRGFL
jgi:hypothetical protein